jgi:hypothetical protein
MIGNANLGQSRIGSVPQPRSVCNEWSSQLIACFFRISVTFCDCTTAQTRVEVSSSVTTVSRGYCISEDTQQTWTVHPSSRQIPWPLEEFPLVSGNTAHAGRPHGKAASSPQPITEREEPLASHQIWVFRQPLAPQVTSFHERRQPFSIDAGRPVCITPRVVGALSRTACEMAGKKSESWSKILATLSVHTQHHPPGLPGHTARAR